MSEETYLDRILAAKRDEIAAHHSNVSRRDRDAQLAALPPPRDFIGALRGEGLRPSVIAEFKRASPSEGDLRPDGDPRHVAALYVDAGAAAISVLTDRHFKGSLDDLRAVRSSVSVPLLCKDFIVSHGQIVDARLAGADAILLIAAALEPPTLRDLLKFAHGLGLTVLCETHDGREVERALACGAKLIGVNARDLRSFEVNLDRVIELRKSVPATHTFVAESGIRSREDVARLREADVDAILVGTHFMKAEDPGLALCDLVAMV
jgi:indole-3-glycerol phosphate synthase